MTVTSSSTNETGRKPLEPGGKVPPRERNAQSGEGRGARGIDPPGDKTDANLRHETSVIFAEASRIASSAETSVPDTAASTHDPSDVRDNSAASKETGSKTQSTLKDALVSSSSSPASKTAVPLGMGRNPDGGAVGVLTDRQIEALEPGHTWISAPADGDCLMHCIAAALPEHHGITSPAHTRNENVENIRSATVAHLEANRPAPGEFNDVFPIVGTADQLISEFKTKGRYQQDDMISHVAKSLDIRIKVVDEAGQKFVVGPEAQSAQPDLAAGEARLSDMTIARAGRHYYVQTSPAEVNRVLDYFEGH